MTKLRRSNLALVYGKYTLLDKENPNIYAYTRELEGKKLLVMLNFSSKKAAVKTGLNTNNATVLSNNYGGKSSMTELRPYEAVVMELK